MRSYNRQKLKAHTAGNDRHHKGTSYLAKQERKTAERARQQSGRQLTPTEVLLRQLRAAERRDRKIGQVRRQGLG